MLNVIQPAAESDTQHYTDRSHSPVRRSPVRRSPSPVRRSPARHSHSPESHSPGPCQQSIFDYELDDVVAAGDAAPVGDLLVYPRLETADGMRAIFEPGDSIQCGRSQCRFLGVVLVNKGDLRVLCVRDKPEALAKVVPLKKYAKIAKSNPDKLCETALSRWINAKSTD